MDIVSFIELITARQKECGLKKLFGECSAGNFVVRKFTEDNVTDTGGIGMRTKTDENSATQYE